MEPWAGVSTPPGREIAPCFSTNRQSLWRERRGADVRLKQLSQDEDREVAAMTTEMRKSGIDVVGDMPWGTHFCLFYEPKESSTRWYLIAKPDWKARSSACGWLPSP